MRNLICDRCHFATGGFGNGDLLIHIADVTLDFDLDQHGSDCDDVTRLTRDLRHYARHGAFHFHCRLVGHHVGDRLILGNRIARLYMPCYDFSLGNTFADVG